MTFVMVKDAIKGTPCILTYMLYRLQSSVNLIPHSPAFQRNHSSLMDWLTQKLQLICSMGKSHLQITLTSSGASPYLLFNGCQG
jgi:hypothetical protein